MVNNKKDCRITIAGLLAIIGVIGFIIYCILMRFFPTTIVSKEFDHEVFIALFGLATLGTTHFLKQTRDDR